MLQQPLDRVGERICNGTRQVTELRGCFAVADHGIALDGLDRIGRELRLGSGKPVECRCKRRSQLRQPYRQLDLGDPVAGDLLRGPEQLVDLDPFAG